MLSAAALAFAAFAAAAQNDIRWDSPAYGDPYAAAPRAAYVSPREAESLVAPIALFPDTLVAQILMAATYPYDVEDAAAWVSDPRNARLVGYGLAAALDGMDWDPSVKALTSAPDVLRMMDERRDWTARLGQAFMADQGLVMDAVQHLRRQARAAGRLYSDRYRRVVVRGGEIVIEPVSASEMYVQFYDPTIAFGVWAYPDDPPYGFPRVYYDVVRPIPLITPLWGWSSWDWRGRHLRVDPGRWRQLAHNRPNAMIGDTWRHDPGRNQGRQFRGGMDRTTFGTRPGFPGNRWDSNRDGNPGGSRLPPPQANANPNPNFHGRGPGLTQDSNQRWRDTSARGRNDRQEAIASPPAPVQPAAPVQADIRREQSRGFGGFDRQDRSELRGDRDGWRQRRQEASANPVPPPQAVPQPQQPDQTRFGRGWDSRRGFERREQATIAPAPQAQHPQAQPQNGNEGGERRFHGRGRRDDPNS